MIFDFFLKINQHKENNFFKKEPENVFIKPTSAAKPQEIFAVPLAPGAVFSTLTSQLPTSTFSKKSSSQEKKQSQKAKKQANQKAQEANNTQLVPTQTQTSRKVKKNEKGETPLHLAVLSVIICRTNKI